MRLFFTLLLSLMSFTSQASEVRFGGLVLLQPEYVLQERGLNVQEFVDFVKSAQASTVNAWKHSKLPASSGFIVVAVREGGKVNAWFDLQPEGSTSEETRALQAIKTVTPFKFNKGTVVFAMEVSLNGATKAKGSMPNPKAWTEAAKARPGPIEAEELVDLVWPRQSK